MTYLEDCLRRKVIFFTGKGGVGKSTLAWSTALLCRQRGLRVRLVSWNPFGAEEVAMPARAWGIEWEPVETMAAFREYALKTLKFETIYKVAFDNHVLRSFIRAAPGLSETVVSGKIWDLYERADQDLLVVDLPASGHAISFFQSPLGVRKIFAVGFVHNEAEKIVGMFGAPTTRVDLVSLPEELPVVETRELKSKLQALHPFHFGFLLMNQCTPEFPLSAPEIAALPPELKAFREQHEAQVMAEHEAMSAASLGMQMLNVPKLAGKGMADTLEAVADFLGSA